MYCATNVLALFICFPHAVSVFHSVFISGRKILPFNRSIVFRNFSQICSSHFFKSPTFKSAIELEVEFWASIRFTTIPYFLSSYFCFRNFVSIRYSRLIFIIRYNVTIVSCFNFLALVQRKICLLLKFTNRVD